MTGPEHLDAQLTVKLKKEEMAQLKPLPRITGDLGLSALARRLLLEEWHRHHPALDWTSEMDELLGTASDSQIGERIGKTRDQIIRRRKELGIPPFAPAGRPSKS